MFKLTTDAMLRILLAWPAVIAAGTSSSQGAAMRHSDQAPATAAGSKARKPGPDTPAEARGRRILSTAFVRVGPDGQLTVETRDGRVLVLRDVVLRPTDFCGVRGSGAGYCGGYADVVAAQPGGAPIPSEPDVAGGKPAEPARRPPPRR